MENCFCDHAAADHAPLQDFGSSMCLRRDCDCDGTREQVAAMRAERRMSPTTEKLVAVIREVLSNPMQRSTDDQARNVAAAIIGNFQVEAYGG